MAKKNTLIKIGEIPKEMIFNAKKERYNPYQGGYGAFKDKKKYTRKEKYKTKYF